MPFARDGHEVHGDGTFIQSLSGCVLRVIGDTGGVLEMIVSVVDGDHPVGHIYRDDYGSWVEARVNNDWYHVVTPCDCPRHQGTLVFPNIPN